MDNLENPYLERIDILEEKLKMKVEELRKERECNAEALRYLFVLVGQLGGRAEVRLSELKDQNGEVICRVDKEEGVVVLKIGREKKRRRRHV